MTFNKDIVNSPLHVWPLPHSVLSFKKSQSLINATFCSLRTPSQNGRFLPGAFEHKRLRAVTNGGAEGTEALANSKDCVRVRRSKVQMSSLKRHLFRLARQALQLLFTHATLQALKAQFSTKPPSSLLYLEHPQMSSYSLPEPLFTLFPYSDDTVSKL